ncbi:hypothetical protein [Cerasicoccus frondis]|uniref:hypothetical protein n=1 Tax=Cerasicoccus frondis TaxID=490090 RepID=UPI0028529DBB|nr:hypothetical protein [Cerasicoccus frondis]
MPNTISALHRLASVLACVIFSISFCTPSAFAAAKKKEAPAVTVDVPDETLVQFMSPDMLREWRRVERGIAQAKADIESGEWLAAKEYSQFVPKQQTDADRKKGKEKIDEGKAQLEAYLEEQGQLRIKTYEAYKNYQAQFDSQSINMTISGAALEEAIQQPTEAMLYKLWNDNYTKILFAGAFVLNNGAYAKAAPLSQSLSDTIANLDGNRYTYVEEVTEFSLDVDKSKPKVLFDSREDTVKRFKPALLIVEIIFDAEAKHGLYALNSFDLKTGVLIDQAILRFPINADTPETLGIKSEELLTTVDPTVSEGAGSESETQSASNNAKPAGLSLTLDDKTNFLGRLGTAKANYFFDVNYVGQIDGYDQRAAILLNNALMREQNIHVDDYEFISQALPLANEDVQLVDMANAEWRVSPTTPVENSEGVYSIRAIAKNGDASIEIGSLTIEPASAESIPPQAKK